MLFALDASSTAVGWALFDGENYHSSGVYKPKGEADDRVCKIGFWLKRREWTYITDIACEIPSGSHRNRHTDRLLGGVFYLVMFIAREHNAKFHKVYPVQVKKGPIHKGTLEIATEFVRVKTGDGERKVKGDEADAIGVALAHLRETDGR